MMRKVSIIGTGYVGLVTGACLADKGHSVVCVDLDPGRVEALNRAECPIHEEGLGEILRRNVGVRLHATLDLTTAVSGSDLTLIAVGTPFDGRKFDLSAVLIAAQEIGRVLKNKADYHVVVVKSTVLPGTTDSKILPALESASGKRAGKDFGLGMNPEFLSEGEAVRDFMFPDRLVFGAEDERTTLALEELYQPFPGVPRICTSLRSAEMIKYVSNALLANLISFSNEMANLADTVGGIDFEKVMEAVHASQYFSGRNPQGLPPITAFLRAGCGFGGSCLPKDVKSLIAFGRQAGESMGLMQSVIRLNEEQPGRVIALLQKHWPDLAGRRIAILGLAFKPGTSDVRESPAFCIARELLDRGARVRAHDPAALADAQKAFPDTRLQYCSDIATALSEADAVVMVTPWKAYEVVPDLLRHRDPPPLFIDPRRAFPRGSFARYEGIGLSVAALPNPEIPGALP